jgi:hypothetical protein
MNYWSLCNTIIILIGFIWLFISVKVKSKKLIIWKYKFKSLHDLLCKALVLQFNEGGERAKIAKEIFESITLFGYPFMWFRCEICGRWRPFKKTGVNQQIIRDDDGEEIGHSNVVFCNDNPDCIKKAPHNHHGVNNEN